MRRQRSMLANDSARALSDYITTVLVRENVRRRIARRNLGPPKRDAGRLRAHADGNCLRKTDLRRQP
jgi:hypothetical protein